MVKFQVKKSSAMKVKDIITGYQHKTTTRTFQKRMKDYNAKPFQHFEKNEKSLRKSIQNLSMEVGVKWVGRKFGKVAEDIMDAKYKGIQKKDVIVSRKLILSEESAKNISAIKNPITYQEYQKIKVPISITDKDLGLLMFAQSASRTNYASTGLNGSRYDLRFISGAIYDHDPNARLHRSVLFGRKFRSQMIENMNSIEIPQRDGYCVYDYVCAKIMSVYKRSNKVKIQEQLQKISGKPIEEGLSVDNIKQLQKLYPRISMYCFNPLNKMFFRSKATRDSEKVVIMVFKINHNHLYPIENEEVFNVIRRGKNNELLNEMKFKVKITKSNYQYIKAVDNYVEKASEKSAISKALDGDCEDDDDDDEDYIEEEHAPIDIRTGEELCKGLDEEKDVYVFDDCELFMRCLEYIMTTTGFVVDRINFNNVGHIVGFLHPTTDKAFIIDANIEERQQVCKFLNKHFETNEFNFKNQTYASLSKRIFKYLTGTIPMNHYNVPMREFMDNNFCRPLSYSISLKEETDKFSAVDIAKCYSSVMCDNDTDYPIYSIYDVPIKGYKYTHCGEYYVKNCHISQIQGSARPFLLPSAVYGANLINKLIDRKYISEDDIIYTFRPSYIVRRDIYKDFIEFCYKNFDKSVAKSLVNSYTGTLNTIYNKQYNGAIVSDTYMAMAMINEYDDVEAFPLLNSDENDLFIVKQETKNRRISDLSSIYRHIISGGIWKLIELIENVLKSNPTASLISVKTDCAVFENAEKFPEFEKHELGLGEYRKEDIPDVYKFVDEYVNEIDSIDLSAGVKGTGVLFCGGGGCGKTWKLKEIFDLIVGNKVVLTKQNSVVSLLISRGFENVMTLDTLIREENGLKHNSEMIAKYDAVFVDEYTMTNNFHMYCFYYALQINPNLKYFFAGDEKQIPNIEDECEVRINYIDNLIAMSMFGSVERLEYIKESARYDEEHHEYLDYFVKNSKLAYPIGKKNDCRLNICYTNKMRREITKRECDKAGGVKITFIYQGKREKYNVSEGMPLMSSMTLKDMKISKNEMFAMGKISTDFEIVRHNGEKFVVCEKLFVKAFIPAFCITSNKIQGGKIEEPYAIHEAERMSKNKMYVALSRATLHDNVNIVSKSCYGKKYFEEPQRDMVRLVDFKGKFDKGKIYKISIEGGLRYIGSTTGTLEKRLEQHFANAGSAVFPYAKKKNKIELLSNYPCSSLRQLEAFEKINIMKYVEKYGEKCLNKKLRGEEIEKIEKKDAKEVFKLKKNVPILQKTIKKNGTPKTVFYYQFRVNGKVVKKEAHYTEENKDEKYDSLMEKLQEDIKKYFG